MKRILFLLSVALLLCSVSAWAQAMSDTQIMEFIQSEMKAGTSQSQIVTKLVQRGVTVDQIRRVRAQYANQRRMGNQNSAYNGTAETGNARLRTENGEMSQELNFTGESRQTVAITDTYYNEENISSQNGIKVFGHDIFNNKLLSFEPNMNIATPQNYVLGPGDVLVIDVYGASQKSHQLTVSPEGAVIVPGYGPIQVGGLTVAAAQSRVRSGLGSRYSSSDVKVSVGQTRTILISVMGEVKAPGTYHLSAFASVFHALYMAGGINEWGTLRNVRVIRDGRVVSVIDVYEYILHGRLAGNISLKEGDVVQVGAYDCLVNITGNVKRPMYYEMRNTESVKTLLDFAGGFTGNAYRKSVRLTRRNGERYGVYNIDEFEQASFRVLDGDSVAVGSMLERYESMAEISGAVFRPGLYHIGEGGVTTVRSLIEQADGLTEDAFTAHAVLQRMRADRSREVIPVDVAGIMAGTVADIPLENEDVLFISTQTELITNRVVTVDGEVLFPGEYEWAANMTIEDLIMQAGGLTDAASVAKVDVSRRLMDPKSVTATTEIAKTYTFSLKDGFIIDGTPGFILEPYDVVQVRRSPSFHKPRQVSVEGEVTFSGSYTLAKKNQRLSDLVKMAGGVTQDAYVKGARLIRHINEMERARMDMARQAALHIRDGRDSVSLEKLSTDSVFMVGIRLDAALKNPGGDADIVLREGDRLVVPEYEGTVKISGDVMYANTVSYAKGKSYKWYIRQAGGFGQQAKKSKAYIVYPNGTMAMARRNTEITPGCEIVVPSKPQKNTLTASQWIGLGTGAASIASMIATIIYMVTR